MSKDEAGITEETEYEERRSLHQEAREEIQKRQFSNSESYDRAILTLSSGFLALSLSFIKGIIPSGHVKYIPVLYWSWAVLAIAIVVTVASFRVSDRALTQALTALHRYYVERDEAALRRTKLTRTVERMNDVSGVLFIGGVLLTVFFVFSNFSEVGTMSKGSSGELTRADGQSVPAAQRVTTIERRGQSVPQIQQVTPQAAKPSGSAPASSTPSQTQQGGGTGKPSGG
jgi:hypothetical protein